MSHQPSAQYIDDVNAQPGSTSPAETPWWRGLPSQCAVCRGWGRGRICGTCTRRFAPPADRCRRCAIRVPPGVGTCGNCVRSSPPFDSALAAVDYAHPWDRLIADLKFNDALDLVGSMSDLLIAAHRQHPAVHPDLMLPVPLGPRRLRERGYNQSWELARRCARTMGCQTEPALLLRIRDTPHQLSLARGQRVANVRGAFAVDPTRRAELKGRTITLIDDVMTTRATAAELTRVLLDAGAIAVHVWVVARTPSPGH
ncbi:MAG: ComF family protein [Pseudomonadota bacterium]|nr:ComF family protein [Pseudomonadota bacterium]